MVEIGDEASQERDSYHGGGVGNRGWLALKPSAVGRPISKPSNLDHSFRCGGIICVAFVGAQGNRLSAGAVFGCSNSNV